MFDAAGVGALNCDKFLEVTLQQLESINSELNKPFVLGKEDFGNPEEFEQTLRIVNKHAKLIGQDVGGSAAQTMVGLSRIGFRTGYLGMVGFDGLGQFLDRGLVREGVDTSRVFIGEVGTGVCISLSEGRDRALRVFPFSNDLLNLKLLDALDTLESYLGKSKIVHMTSFACSLGYEPLEVQKRIAEQLADRVMISFSPGELYVSLGLKTLKPILERAHILFVNRGEIQTLTGEDYIEGSKKLLMSNRRLRYVVSTLGDGGAHLRYRGGEFLAEPIKIPEGEIKPEGLTGAGDYLAAGVLAGMLRQYSPESCMNLGNKVVSMKLRGLEREAYRNVEV